MVLISDFDPDDSSGIHVRFRPLAGIMVLILFHCLLTYSRHLSSFRPLTGIMVLIGFISVKDPVVGKTEGNYICM